MALTLLEASKLNPGDVYRDGVIETFVRTTDILRVLPFIDVAGGVYNYSVEGELPGIAFRGVNESYTEDTGVINPESDPVKDFGGDMDVDKLIVATQGAEQRAVHEQMKLKAAAQKWAYTFIKGDSTSNNKEFDGLQVRLTGGQVISNSAASGGAGLSLTKLDEAIDAVDEPTHIVMSKALRRLLTASTRATGVSGYLTHTMDEFGRQMTMYNDLPIVVADENGNASPALAFDEAYTGGGTSNGTSLYVVSMQEGMLFGIQNKQLEARDLGELQTKPVFRTRVDWYSGFAVAHPRAAARLRNISNAAVTA
jgi:hypothetical protein